MQTKKKDGGGCGAYTLRPQRGVAHRGICAADGNQPGGDGGSVRSVGRSWGWVGVGVVARGTTTYASLQQAADFQSEIY